jgi:hypothetical protein
METLAELKERILNRCEWRDGPLETPCLIWTGGCSSGGYGSIKYQGTKLATHRVLWLCEYGKIEEGKELCHECDTPPCNSLLHLRADTRAGNMADAFRRGRLNRRGDNNSYASLTARQVSLIKYFLQQGWRPGQLAERYWVAPSTIAAISSGTTWSHVQPFQPLPGEPLPVPPGIKPTTSLVRRF